MWPPALTLDLLLVVGLALSADGARASFTPQNCSLDCVRRGDPKCEYCRIAADVEQSPFGSCVPRPCLSFLGTETPDVCQHYVHAPHSLRIEFEADGEPAFDAVTVSWSPSQFGIVFLRGFQVTLQALGGSRVSCQIFLLGNNLSLTPAHAQTVFRSDLFTRLSLDSEYAVTVMALPVPERWDQFYQKKHFFTRTCTEKNGLEKCKKDWHPTYVHVHQKDRDVYVTFNLAPESFAVRQYFSSCFGRGVRNYTSIKPDFSLNKTHHTYRLQNLQAGTNYSCEIAADVVDAVRKTFVVVVKHNSEETLVPGGPPLPVLLSVGVLLAATVTLTLTVVYKKRLKLRKVQSKMRPELIEQYYEKKQDEGQCVLLEKSARPPRLLILYSSADGPAHVRVVLQLAAFLQKHMATQVHLDLWEALGIMQEGSMGWHCRRMKECDFVLVVCSRGLLQTHNLQSEGEPLENMALAAVSMIGEELCRAKALGRDLSKYMTAVFEYSRESDIPSALSLASRYDLMKDLHLLFSHLHGVSLQKPGVYLQVENISESGYSDLPAGAALQLAIQTAVEHFSEEPEPFQRDLH